MVCIYESQFKYSYALKGLILYFYNNNYTYFYIIQFTNNFVLISKNSRNNYNITTFHK